MRGYDYNAFALDTLETLTETFGEGAIYQPAREFSVAIYIHADAFIGVDLTKLRDATKADEIGFITPQILRFWFG